MGGEAQAAAGPVGRNASARTDVLLHAEILSWSRSRGLIAGLSLEGSTLRPDKSEDAKVYGETITNEQILQGEARTPRRGSAAGGGAESLPETGDGDVNASLRDRGRFTLRNVHFATGKADITPDSESSLTEAANVLKEHADWKIRVEGIYGQRR